MKAIGIFVAFLLVFCKCSETEEQSSGGTEKKRKPFLEGGPIDREEFKKNFKDMLGHTWTMFDMENLDSYILPVLNYSRSALEPYFTREQVLYHYEGNVEQHRKQLVAALREWKAQYPDDRLARDCIVEMLANFDSVPLEIYERIVTHAAAYVNHALFFGLLSANPEGEQRLPFGPILRDIQTHFGSFEGFKEKIHAAVAKLKGPGNVFLVRRKEGQLKVEAYPENFTPLMTGGYPLLVLDLWEHAWYLKHHHQRALYVDDWWMVVDWHQVNALNEFWESYAAKKDEGGKKEKKTREDREEKKDINTEEKEEL